jgi:dihydroorotate dehydrogenase
MGFGFVEIGTVTPLAQPGNEKPRLFRLKADRALINRMGFNNDGVQAIAARLKKWKEPKPRGSTGIPGRMLIGGNIGKNKVTPNEDAWKDYVNCFSALYDCVDYFVVNVSSPNTPGLRELQQKESLRTILVRLQDLNQEKSKAAGITTRPLLLKIAPDLTRAELDDIIDLALEIHLDGIVATNTTIDRTGLGAFGKKFTEQIGQGGLSGKPLLEKSTDVLAYIHEQTKGSMPLIASGGIFTSQDARQKSSAGATLLQVWTGFIYEGPSVVKNILS